MVLSKSDQMKDLKNLQVFSGAQGRGSYTSFCTVFVILS